MSEPGLSDAGLNGPGLPASIGATSVLTGPVVPRTISVGSRLIVRGALLPGASRRATRVSAARSPMS